MSYGFQLRGSHGDIVVDQNFRNLVKIGEGSSGLALTTLTFSSQFPGAPQIFVRPWKDEDYVGNCNFVNNTTVTLRTNKLLWATGSNVVVDQGNVGFDWVMFATNNPIPLDNSNHGVVVLNQNNQLIFDSRYEVPRVQQILYADQPGTASMVWPVSYSFSGWGGRPWIGINPFSYAIASEEEEAAFFVTTTGTNIIKIRQGTFITSAPNQGVRWVNRQGEGVTIPFPGRRADVALLRRYND